ncbi:MAG: sigma-70 family RNA polymerase sigma factor [Phycicoccus sp.]
MARDVPDDVRHGTDSVLGAVGADAGSAAGGPDAGGTDVARRGLDVDASYVRLYQDGYLRLVTQLVAVTGDLAEAEDVVQEAFVRAAERWSTVRHYDAPEAWVRRVALNLALSTLRRARRAAQRTLQWRRDLDPGTAPSPDTALVERLSVTAALQRLPEPYRVVLALHYLADLDVHGIATELSVPVGTVKTRLARGRRRLRTAMEEER